MTDRMNRINALGNNAVAAKAGLSAITKETGVPAARLEAEMKNYGVGPAALLVVNEMVKATGKPAATFYKQRPKTSWETIAAENKFDLTPVLPKLDRVEKTMQAAQGQARTKR